MNKISSDYIDENNSNSDDRIYRNYKYYNNDMDLKSILNLKRNLRKRIRSEVKNEIKKDTIDNPEFKDKINYNKIKDKFKSFFSKKDNNGTSEENTKVYDTYNFDDSLLLYEGKNSASETKLLLERLIQNANSNLYTNTTVTAKNFSSLNITTEYSYKDNNIEEYVSNLEKIKNSIDENSEYIVSFGYSKYKTHVNEVIIEKN